MATAVWSGLVRRFPLLERDPAAAALRDGLSAEKDPKRFRESLAEVVEYAQRAASSFAPAPPL